ncbi:cation transporter [Corynebacterium hylobatis]|uniref:cation transporter n=1 Tax=Corynebacterium hylobatis TaxID=1859290 RepID=UPI0026798D69
MSRAVDTRQNPVNDPLPEDMQKILKKAIRLEWITIIYMVFAVTIVGLVAGQSQAMRAAWVEDMLGFLPPIAFLIATRFTRRAANRKHPYGYHRAIGVGHLVSATALLLMGGLLLFNSAMGLISQEKPPIGITVLFGYDIWAGWLMVGAMLITGIIPVILGRMKLKLAEPLHDKVLRADADMQKADWMTAFATIIGVLGIGVGLWWMDGAVAILVSGSIIYDGMTNLKAAIEDLTDTYPMRFDDSDLHPLIEEAADTARAAVWVQDAAARGRDQGRIFHVEVFVVLRDGQAPTVRQLEELRDRIRQVHWKLYDIVVIPVPELPQHLVES